MESAPNNDRWNGGDDGTSTTMTTTTTAGPNPPPPPPEASADDQMLMMREVADRVRILLGNANLRRDKNLRRLILNDNNETQGIPVQVLLRYYSIKQLTSDPTVLVNAIRKHLVGYIEVVVVVVVENNKETVSSATAVKRVDFLTMDQIGPTTGIPLTLMLGNIPPRPKQEYHDRGEDAQALKNEIKTLFGVYGNVGRVSILYKQQGAATKGSVLVEFDEEKGLQAALEAHILTCRKNGTQLLTVEQQQQQRRRQRLRVRGNEISVVLLQDAIDELQKRFECNEERVMQKSLQKFKKAKAELKLRSEQGVLEIPEWKNLPFCPDQPVYLYQLSAVVINNNINNNNNNNNTTNQDMETRPRPPPSPPEANLGLLLPLDLFELSHLHFCVDQVSVREEYEALFPLCDIPDTKKEGAGLAAESMVVRLVRKRTYHDGFTTQQLRRLRHFHRILWNWKDYDKGYHKAQQLDVLALHKLQQAPPQDDDDDATPLSSSASTCLFVPTIQNNTPTTTTTTTTTTTEVDIDSTSSFAIDWNLIEHEIHRQTIPFLQHPRLLGEKGDSIDFQNYLAIHRGTQDRYRILGRSTTTKMTAKSPFPTATQHGEIPQSKIDEILEKYDLDLTTASFAEYFQKRYNMLVENEDELLLEARLIEEGQGLSGENWYFNEGGSCEEQQRQQQHVQDMPLLIPDFVEILPVPLSTLFTVSLAPHFMPALEREIDLCLLAHRFRLCALDKVEHGERKLKDESQHNNNIVDELNNGGGQQASSYVSLASLLKEATAIVDELDKGQQASTFNVSLAVLLGEATTLFPKSTYDRLEHLGDAVLAYFSALNGVASSKPFDWESNSDLAERVKHARDHEDIGALANEAGRNEILIAAAKSIQLADLLYQKTDFRSCYVGGKTKKTGARVPDKTLADCVESIMAAAFLAKDGERLVICFLNFLSLPFHENGKFPCWFQAPGAALSKPYPIGKDDGIKSQISRTTQILQSNPRVRRRLESGRQKLFDLLSLASSLPNDSMGGDFDTLLHCALFDDDLMIDEDNGQRMDKSNFLPLVFLRDSLYSIGAYALQLMMTEEFFQTFGNAASNELHLLRACAINDDVIAYVMVKNRIHECLYDQNSECIPRFTAKMQEAESIVAGWQRKQQQQSANGPGFVLEKYPGLVGGRLAGSKNKKLATKITEELMVSFKTIVGALVLSVGAETMWRAIIRVLFRELIALSPERIFDLYTKESNLVQTYARKSPVAKQT